jgi:hypothetical protein
MTDPVNDNGKVQDLQKKRELHDAAKELFDNKAFQAAIIELRKRWYDQILAIAKGEQRDELIAMSKTLDSIPIELSVIMNDYKKAVHDAARRQAHG